MPNHCWTYFFTIVLAAVAGWWWMHRVISSSEVRDKWIVRHGYNLIFWALTTGGSILLARWGVVESGPIVGLFWTIGVVIGMTIEHEREIKNHSTKGITLPVDDYHAVRACARINLLRFGSEETQRKVAEEVRKARKRLAKEETDRNVLNLRAEVERLQNGIRRLSGIASDASKRAYTNKGTQWDPYDVLQFIANEIAHGFQCKNSPIVSIYFVSNRKLFKYLGAKNHTSNNHARGVTVEQYNKLLEVAMHSRTVIDWPDEADEIEALAKIGAPKGGTRVLVIPLPYFDDLVGSHPDQKKYGAIYIEVERPAQFDRGMLIALACATLVEACLTLSRTSAETLGLTAATRLGRTA